jgi:trk system potassium uptake protein TrkA
MKIVIVGCGRMGADLAYRLFKRGHEVAVVDGSPLEFNHLPSDFQGRIHEGDPLSQDVLHRAGIETADAFAAVTESDALNLVLARVAAVHYKVPHVVARNYEPMLRSLYEDFNIQVVSAVSWAAQRLEEMIYHTEVRAVFSAGNGEVEVYELTVPENWSGRQLGELTLNGHVIPVAFSRCGVAEIPDRQKLLEHGDIIHVSATLDGVEALRKRLGMPYQEVKR